MWDYCVAGGSTEKALREMQGTLRNFGINVKAKHIVQARPSTNNSKNNKNRPITITYSSPVIRREVAVTAAKAGMWEKPKGDGSRMFFYQHIKKLS